MFTCNSGLQSTSRFNKQGNHNWAHHFGEATGHHVSFIKQLDPSPTFPVRSSKRMAPRLHQSQASVSSRIAPTSKHETFQLILKRSVTPSKLTYIYKVTV